MVVLAQLNKPMYGYSLVKELEGKGISIEGNTLYPLLRRLESQGLLKSECYFDEHRRMIEVQTHNTDLKKRLTVFAAKYPQCCRQTDDDEQGGLTFEIEKGRLSFRLTAPYSEERRRAASEQAKQNGVHGYNF